MPEILIAEDNAVQAKLLRAVLESHGYTVSSADNGTDAFGLFQTHSFDIVISDVVMPGLSGYELCRAIKADRCRGGVPVMLLTSLSEPMDIVRGLECGADNFFIKPYNVGDLIVRIEQILRNRRVRRSSEVSHDVEIEFLGSKFTISSDKEQIIDLLFSAFEDMVRANQELRRSQSELTTAKLEIQAYASGLEDRVKERTADLVRVVEDLRAEIEAHKRTEAQLVHAQRMEAIGNLSGGMAHDFNNLLGVIIGNLDLISDSSANENLDTSELVREAVDAALRGSELTRRLLAFARRQPLRPELVDVNDTVNNITKLLRRILGEDIAINLDLAPSVHTVVVDPAQLEASLANLAANARDAMPRGGRLSITTRDIELDVGYAEDNADVVAGDYTLIEVSDTGEGMGPETRKRIFEPFFTTKQAGNGTGLGLSMVFGFVKQSGGHISVYSESGVGSTFRIYLPHCGGSQARKHGPISNETVLGDGQVILAVEDNLHLRRVLVRQLRELNYQVIEAQDATTALSILEGKSVDLIFTDIIMPGKNGIDLARTVAAQWPQIRIVLMSGFPGNHLRNGGNIFDQAPILSKPFRKDVLAQTLWKMFSS